MERYFLTDSEAILAAIPTNDLLLTFRQVAVIDRLPELIWSDILYFNFEKHYRLLSVWTFISKPKSLMYFYEEEYFFFFLISELKIKFTKYLNKILFPISRALTYRHIHVSTPFLSSVRSILIGFTFHWCHDHFTNSNNIYLITMNSESVNQGKTKAFKAWKQRLQLFIDRFY